MASQVITEAPGLNSSSPIQYTNTDDDSVCCGGDCCTSSPDEDCGPRNLWCCLCFYDPICGWNHGCCCCLCQCIADLFCFKSL